MPLTQMINVPRVRRGTSNLKVHVILRQFDLLWSCFRAGVPVCVHNDTLDIRSENGEEMPNVRVTKIGIDRAHDTVYSTFPMASPQRGSPQRGRLVDDINSRYLSPGYWHQPG